MKAFLSIFHSSTGHDDLRHKHIHTPGFMYVRPPIYTIHIRIYLSKQVGKT